MEAKNGEDVEGEEKKLLRQKEEELKAKEREHEKLWCELKKLQKLKEFKLTVTFSVGQTGKDKKKKKKGCI